MKKKIMYVLGSILVFFERRNKVIDSWLSEIFHKEPDVELVKKIKFNRVSRVPDNKLVLESKKIAPSGIPEGRKVSTQANLTGSLSVYKISNVELKGKFPIIYKNRALILDSVFFSAQHDRIGEQRRFNHLYFCKRALKLNFIKKKQIISSPSMLMFSKWNHYGHWVPEHLLKALLLKKALGNKAFEVNLILEDEFPVWKLEFLKILGWDESKVVSWNVHKATFNELYCPSYPEPNYDLFLELKEELVRHYSILPLTNKRRVYLSRNRYGTRGVENENELIDFLETFGFEILYPELMTTKEQLSAFVNAEVVIGPHGSAFTNIIFSEKTKVVEFFGEYVPLAFYCYSLVMGHDYKALYCSSGDSKDDNMIVDIEELEAIFRDIGVIKNSE